MNNREKKTPFFNNGPADHEEFGRIKPDDEWHDDDCREEPGPLEKWPARRHVRPALLLFVLFYTASTVYGNSPAGAYLWASGRTVFNGHEYWRIFTSLFVHADLLHLLSNALMFIIFGWLLRAYYGFVIFPLASIVVGAAATATTLALYTPETRLIGASGMIYGMAAIWLVLYIRFEKKHTPALRVLRAVGFVMVMLVPSTIDPGISYLSHAVGFVWGFAAGTAAGFLVSVRDPS